MKTRQFRAGRALVSAGALLLVVGCGGAATPPPTSAAATPGAQSSTEAGQTITTVAGVELVAGKRKLKVAGPAANETGNTPAMLHFRQRGRAATTERSEVQSEGFRVSDLPKASIPEPLSAAQAPSAPPEGDEAGELYVDWPSAVRANSIIPRPETYTSVRVSLRGQRLARIRIGGSEGTVVGGAGGGVYVVCRVPDDAPRRFVSARWESLSTPSSGATSASTTAESRASAGAAGSVTLTVTDAWFDMRECKGTVVRRTSIQVKPLSGGLLFAYREPCAKCAPGAQTELVTFLGPMPQTITASGVGGDAVTIMGAVTRVSLPVRRGGGGSVLARYSPGIVSDWLGSLVFPKERTPATDVVAGVDITQGVGDPEPVAIAYVSRTGAASPEPQPRAMELDLFGLGSSPPPQTARKPNGDVELIDPFAARLLSAGSTPSKSSSKASKRPAIRIPQRERLGF